MSSHRAKKELEEARKAGTVAPEKDAEGNLINPHIPEFMAKAPWYLSQEGPGLAHQRKAEATRTSFGFTTYYRRGEYAGQATSYRKGACKNCGAITHTEKDCTERPRAKGAWKTNADIRPDEILPESIKLDYDTKRDRYNGYDPAMHAATIARYAAAEEERKRVRAGEKAKEEEERAARKAAEKASKEARRAARAAKKAAKAEARAAQAAAAAAAAAAGGSAGADGAPADGAAGTSGYASDGGSTASNVSGATDDGRKAKHPRAAVGGAGTGDAADGGGDGDDSDDSDSVTSSDSDASGKSHDSDFSSSDDEGAGGSDEDDLAGVRERESHEAAGQGLHAAGTKAKMSVRNLRVREDRAKYLINLDVDSAHYDPKTRSMRENPLPGGEGDGEDEDAGAGTYRGDNAWRQSGDVSAIAQSTMFAWEAAERGVDLNLLANPTQVELLRRQHAARKAELAAAQKAKVTAAYVGGEAGGAATTAGAAAAPSAGVASASDGLILPKEMLVYGQGESYVEYTRDGRVIGAPGRAGAGSGGGAAAAAAAGGGGVRRSRYEEDVHPGNHSSVWGSWYDRETGSWGYACCHNVHHGAYCTGSSGRAALDEARRHAAGAAADAGAESAPASSAAAAGGVSGVKRKRPDDGAASGAEGSGGGGGSGGRAHGYDDDKRARRDE